MMSGGRIEFESEIEETVRYLASNKAIKSINANLYWPKWDSPWWHMLLLHEMGETKRIPSSIIEKMVDALDKSPLKIFPFRQEEMPVGLDPFRDTHCHCSLGNIYQVLASWGISVDQKLPWIRSWFLNYQMSDGGLNCDNDAYLVKDEVPSSMVGTIAPFESILLYTRRPWTSEEMTFLNRGAQFLIGRKLVNGSPSKHNAVEREIQAKWLKVCFPRFYFYDVLRGLNVILIWSEKTKQSLPIDAIRDVVLVLKANFPDDNVKNERHSYDGTGTILYSPSGEWVRRQPATFFPLLTKVSPIGSISPYLSKQWVEAKKKISDQPHLKELVL